ncbi:MAG: hypothetical protein WAZ14_02155 [Patescibacteria group bacterium]
MGAKIPEAELSGLAEAREYGQHLAALLASSSFTPEQKQAWATLVPEMSPAQLIKFDDLLRLNLQTQSAGELEHVFVDVQAARHKFELSLAALNEQTHQALDEIEAELT